MTGPIPGTSWGFIGSAPELFGVAQEIGEWPVRNASTAIVGVDGLLCTAHDPDHRYNLASVTKPLAALTVLVAVEEEALGLDDPLGPLLGAGAEPFAEVTIRHLLSHAGGVAMDRPIKAAEPGTRRIYSNLGIDLAGAAVAAATGMDFQAYFAEAVAAPLQLSGATQLGERPSRDGVSTVRDLAKVVAELLNPTGLLHASTLAALATVQFPGLPGVLPGFGPQRPNGWGLGFEIRDHKSPHWTGAANSPATYGHFGQSGTFVWIDPVARLGLVALTDEPFGQWAAEAWPKFSDTVLEAFAEL